MARILDVAAKLQQLNFQFLACCVMRYLAAFFGTVTIQLFKSVCTLSCKLFQKEQVVLLRHSWMDGCNMHDK
jgi:hypothetical protein